MSKIFEDIEEKSVKMAHSHKSLALENCPTPLLLEIQSSFLHALQFDLDLLIQQEEVDSVGRYPEDSDHDDIQLARDR